MDRREYLRGVGVGAVAALAGCADLLGYEPEDRDREDQSPTEQESTTAPPPATPTRTPTRTVTEQPTPTRSPTPEPTSAPTTTPTPTSTPTDSPTASPLPSPTPTRSPTPTPTPTATPDRAPRLVDGTLVEAWPGAADFDDNAMGAVGRGATAEVGFAFDVWAGDGQARVAAEATVSHRREEVASESGTDARVVERADEFTRLYWALPSDTTEWALGEHTAEITLRDRNLDAAASPYRFDFEVARPLEGEEVTYVRYEGPDPVTAGEPFEFEVYVRNESRRDSSVVSTVQERRNVDEWYEIDPSVALNLASGNERSFGGEWQVDRPGNYEWRLPGVDVKWRVEVEEAD